MSLGDTLILKIFEQNLTEKNVLYVFFDIEKGVFEIRGKRYKTIEQIVDFSFKTKNKKVLNDFIKLFFVETNQYDFDLLNASNLSVDSKHILFEDIQKYDDKIIIGFHYNNQKTVEEAEGDLTKFLNIIQYFQNDDYLFGENKNELW